MKKSPLSFSLIIAFSLILTACGTFNNDNAGENGKDGESSQHLRINIKTEPPTLNPGLASDSTSGVVLNHAFEGLTRINKDYEPEEAMAEKIDISEDKKTYTFTIRDAIWSNGDPVTANDFEYAWKWVLDPKNQADYASHIINNIAGAKEAYEAGLSVNEMDNVGIKAVDEKTLEITLNNPTDYFLELTAFYTFYPVNSKLAKENPDWAKKVNGSYVSNGPFIITDTSGSITLKRNENYWDKDAVKLEKITMDMLEDVTTELKSFEKGELDWAGAPTSSLPTDAIKQLTGEGALKSMVIAGAYWYKFNINEAPFTNVNIRKALAYAIDRQAIIDNITQGGQLPAMALVPPTMIPENENGYFKDNDVDMAKEFLQKGLQELGLSDVSELPEIKLSFNTDEGNQKIAQAIQDMWRKHLGVEVTLNNAEWAVYLDNLDQGKFQIARTGWLGDFNDPVNFLEIYTEPAGNNNTGWTNEEYNQLLAKAAQETNVEKRLQLLKNAEAIIMKEMPVAPIYFYTQSWVQDENLKGVILSPLGDVSFKEAYFE